MLNRKSIFNLLTNRLRTNRCKIQRPYGMRSWYNSEGALTKIKNENKNKKRRKRHLSVFYTPFDAEKKLVGWMSHAFPQNNNLNLS